MAAPKFQHHTKPTLLARQIQQDILRGQWVDTLPGYRQLAAHYDSSHRTTMAAIHLLESQGVLSGQTPGRRRRIIPTSSHRPQLQKLLILLEHHSELNLDSREFIHGISEYWKNRGGHVEWKEAPMRRTRNAKSSVQRLIREHQPLAIMVFGGTIGWLSELVATGIPVFCDGGETTLLKDQICATGYSIEKAASTLLTKLRQMGHTRILFPYYGKHDDLLGYLRDGYTTSLGDLYSQSEIEAFTPVFAELVPEVWLSYWRTHLSKTQPTAVICHTQQSLLSLYGFCSMAGIRTPQDLSVSVLGYEPRFEWLWPKPHGYSFPTRKAIRLFQRWVENGFPRGIFKNYPLEEVPGDSLRLGE
ncbi:DNA-binding transcriptional regulator, LacI/PurR family [Rubritalea squalenifaciens DSM 18772]|uniref:DNA-binding transcriptional regulator, LacI/PurR family n=1 Tax=Rubritalea squalenifaciens DSM 18772 TaxID=1123071 RepID=A0A1M6CD06_9BACT|nr:substrate-binding domain-containing protein [Rubritalea squalenifaciens]SHI58935.1 DNA-binding transcriptional regulator, LacI/PurR family [Rubritalea squalenifaciens DSM 18772]